MPPVPPGNDTCITDSMGNGICYCFTDLCNGSSSVAAFPVVLLAAFAVARGVLQNAL